MNWSDIPWNPSARTLRQFAGLWIAFFTALGCWHGFAHGQPGVGLALVTLALTVGPVSFLWPKAIRPVFVGWLVLAFPIGWVVSRLLLAGLFHGLFTPVALLFRLAGRDALRLRRDAANLDSYWLPKPAAAAESYFRQF